MAGFEVTLYGRIWVTPKWKDGQVTNGLQYILGFVKSHTPFGNTMCNRAVSAGVKVTRYCEGSMGAR